METLGISNFLISPAFHRLSRPCGGGALVSRSSVPAFRCSPSQHYVPPFPSVRRSLLSPPSAILANKEEAARFEEASRNGGNLVPLYRCIFCDHLTPVLAYRCLVREDEREAPSFLFESVEQGSQGTNMVTRLQICVKSPLSAPVVLAGSQQSLLEFAGDLPLLPCLKPSRTCRRKH